MVGLVGASVIAFGGSLLLLKLTDLIFPLRVKESEEVMGLDVSQHGEGYLSWVKDENGIHAMKETPGKNGTATISNLLKKQCHMPPMSEAFFINVMLLIK